jgi:hypothetical protein
MKKVSYKIILICSISLLFPYKYLKADVVVTNDGMVLTGKIIKENKTKITISNFHGTFKIEKGNIKRFEKTLSYKRDIQLLKKLGKNIDENEVKRNFQTGQLKLEKFLEPEKVSVDKPEYFTNIFISPIFQLNNGKLSSVLKYAYGGSLTCDFDYYKKSIIHSLRIESDYIYSKKNENTEYDNTTQYISGGALTVGPVLKYSINTKCRFLIALTAGIGYYKINSNIEKTDAIKFKTGIASGFTLYLSRITINPQIGYSYIHDGEAPLMGFNTSLGVGYIF